PSTRRTRSMWTAPARAWGHSRSRMPAGGSVTTSPTRTSLVTVPGPDTGPQSVCAQQAQRLPNAVPRGVQPLGQDVLIGQHPGQGAAGNLLTQDVGPLA